MNPAEFANIARSEQSFWWFRGMNRIMFDLFDPIVGRHSIHRVLEAGCGTGYFAQLLEKRYGWSVYPLDLGWAGLVHGRSLGVRRLIQADIARLPCLDSVFDAVLSMDVLVHFPPGEERQAFAELTRALKPGGLLAIRVSALQALRSNHSKFTDERQRFTRSRLLKLAAQNNLRVIRCTYANSLLMPIALAKFRIWEPLFDRRPASGVQPVGLWLDTLLHSALKIESACIRSGLNFPLGQSLILLARK